MRIFLLAFLFLPLIARCQTGIPSYPEVLRTFFRDHNDSRIEFPEGLAFAKKRDGWYVQVESQMIKDVKEVYLFWSSADKKFRQIETFTGTFGEDYRKQKLSEYLQQNSTLDFYGYERCRYYGYSGWERDMIAEFGKQSITSLTDTLLEGLGRAYSSYANTFLWNQYSDYIDNTDSFHRQLGALEQPTPARIDSAAYYFEKTNAVYQVLASRNPGYQTRVGNSGMKTFTEAMHAWMQMSFCGNEERAKKFLSLIKPNRTVAAFARNYLSNLPPNSILITAGDNDTYTLLYLQENEGYRKDVSVINISLLGLPHYLAFLESKKIVHFSTRPGRYASPSFLYSTYQENGKDTILELEDLIDIIQKSTYPQTAGNGDEIASYPGKKIRLMVDPLRFHSPGNKNYLSPSINFELQNFLTIDQFMALDILLTNLYSRPVYFSYPFDLMPDQMQEEGLVYRFLPLDPGKKQVAADSSMARLERFINTIYTPAPSNNFSDGINPGLDNGIPVFTSLALYFLERNEKEKALRVLNHLVMNYNNQFPFSLFNLQLGDCMLQAGLKEQGLSILESFAKNIMQLFKEPSALQPYIDKENADYQISQVKEILKQHGMESWIVNNLLMALENNR